MPLYQTKAAHAENNQNFIRLMNHYHTLRFIQPNPERAPYLWRVIFADKSVGIWPHVAKARQDGCPAIEGWDQIEQLLASGLTNGPAEQFEAPLTVEGVIHEFLQLGFTSCPIENDLVQELIDHKFTLNEIYSIGCDINAGIKPDHAVEIATIRLG